jgi:hypothetical protein
MTSLAHSSTNDHRFEDMLKEVKAFGRDSAEGKDSLPKLAHKVVRACHEGYMTAAQAHDVYVAYAEERSKKAIHDHSADGVKANASKLRKLAEMGEMPIIDPVDVMNRTYSVREEMAKADEDLKPVYSSYVDVARAQLDSPGCALTDAEIKGIVAKAPPKEKTAETVLKDIHKKLEKLITGEGGVKDQSSEVVQAEEQIRARLAAMLSVKEAEFYGLPAPEIKAAA